MALSKYKRFILGKTLTEDQKNFYDLNGFIHFENYIAEDSISKIISSTEKFQKELVDKNAQQVNGIPLMYGVDDKGNQIIHRLPFTNLFCADVKNLLEDERLQMLGSLAPGSRIATDEKEGVGLNYYINIKGSSLTRLGWHTDGLLDIFAGKKPSPFPIAGIYLDDSSEHNGALRLLPGTHRQGVFSLLFKKFYFLNNNYDPNEITITAKKGDLVLHDGRMWHRVAQAPEVGEKSRRRVLFIYFLTGKYNPKNADSKIPLFFRLLKLFK